MRSAERKRARASSKHAASPRSRARTKGRATEKRDRFIHEYLVDFNATRAANRAGYSPRTVASQGQRLLRSSSIAEAIGKAQTRLLNKTEQSIESWLKKLATFAFLDPGQLFDLQSNLLPRMAVPKDARHGLDDLKVDELFAYDKGQKKHIGRRYRLNLSSKIEALKVLGKFLRRSTPVSEVARTKSQPPIRDERGARTPDPFALGIKRPRSHLRVQFAVEYLKDFNATQAAIRAGYSDRTAASQGQRLLKSPSVQRAIADAGTKSLKKSEISRERWREELEAIAFVDLGNFFDQRGSPLPIKRIPEENRRALMSFEIKELFDSNLGEKRQVLFYKADCSGRLAALEMLAEDLKLI